MGYVTRSSSELEKVISPPPSSLSSMIRVKKGEEAEVEWRGKCQLEKILLCHCCRRKNIWNGKSWRQIGTLCRCSQTPLKLIPLPGDECACLAIKRKSAVSRQNGFFFAHSHSGTMLLQQPLLSAEKRVKRKSLSESILSLGFRFDWNNTLWKRHTSFRWLVSIGLHSQSQTTNMVTYPQFAVNSKQNPDVRWQTDVWVRRIKMEKVFENKTKTNASRPRLWDSFFQPDKITLSLQGSERI